jgi:hypothetical protein
MTALGTAEPGVEFLEQLLERSERRPDGPTGIRSAELRQAAYRAAGQPLS